MSLYNPDSWIRRIFGSQRGRADGVLIMTPDGALVRTISLNDDRETQGTTFDYRTVHEGNAATLGQ